ncbi:hypothetical protein HDU93_003492 [Gonapodya sp. JEL0774]|nr:hypothetical protein HDU93_003492 [Gonapodya sp. JEL0774]
MWRVLESEYDPWERDEYQEHRGGFLKKMLCLQREVWILADLASRRQTVPGWPSSLEAFVRGIGQVSLDFNPPQTAQARSEDCLRLSGNPTGMKPKKVAEVDALASLIAQVAASVFGMEKAPAHNAAVIAPASANNASPIIIDFGCGQGYLTRRLAQDMKCRVIGVDSSPVQTAGARRRAGGSGDPSATIPASKDGLDLHYVQRTLTNSDDWKAVVQEFSAEGAVPLVVVGLHTCGDLAITALRSFVNTDQVYATVNVGCCYNLLTSSGFPLSECLRTHGFDLDRDGKSLANQNVARWSDDINETELTFQKLFFRAILDVIFHDLNIGPTSARIRKLPDSAYSTFPTYVRESCRRIDVPLDLLDSQLLAYHDNLLPRRGEIMAYAALQKVMGLVFESVVLVDRLRWLLASVGDDCDIRMYPYVEPEISPRNVAIVAKKRKV